MAGKVMVVDDSLMVRQQVSRALTDAGFAVVEASDGADALAKLAEATDTALVVLDVNMPNMGGLQLLECLRGRDEAQDVARGHAHHRGPASADAAGEGARRQGLDHQAVQAGSAHRGRAEAHERGLTRLMSVLRARFRCQHEGWRGSVLASWRRSCSSTTWRTPPLAKRKAIDVAFDEVGRFWTKHVDRKVYCVVDYTNLIIEPSVLDHWSDKRAMAVKTYSYTTVRYGAALGTRVALRAMAVRTHVPSNVYATRDQAIAIVRGIRAGTIMFKNTG